MILPGIRTELANAIRAVNARLLELPESKRPELATAWSELEDEIEAACARGDHTVAEAAVERWRDDCLERIRRCRA
jgi:hypothetical protein